MTAAPAPFPPDAGGAGRAAGPTPPAPGSQPDGGAGPEEGEPVLPEVVRSRVLALAATALGRLPADQVPPALRAAARFTPSKRVRLAGPALAATLSADAVFRLRAAEQVELESPDMAEAARTGVLPGAADPVELAAAAYLLRPAGWTELVERSRTALEERAARTRHRARDAELDKLRAELADAHAASVNRPQKARAAAEAARAEADTLRRQLREQTGERRAAERARSRRRGGAGRGAPPGRGRGLPGPGRAAPAAAAAGRGRGRGRVRPARGPRHPAGRRGQALAAARYVTGAAQGLRRELALTPTDERPADSVAAAHAGAGRGQRPRRRPRATSTGCSGCPGCTSSWTATT